MEESKIYDLLESELLHKWKDQIEETEKENWLFTRVQEVFEKLEKELDEQEKEIVAILLFSD